MTNQTDYIDVNYDSTIKFKVKSHEGLPTPRSFWEKDIYTWEPFTVETVKRFASKEKTFIDFGAWEGIPILMASFLYKDCIGIEADPVSFEVLSDNIKVNNISNIKTYNFAIDRLDNLKIKIYADQFSNSGTSKFRPDKKQCVEVDTRRLDTICSDLNFGDIGLISCDIEGGEYEFMSSHRQFLKDHNCPIMMSFHPSIRYIPNLDEILEIYTETYSEFMFEKIPKSIKSVDSLKTILNEIRYDYQILFIP